MGESNRAPMGLLYWPGWCLVILIYISHVLLPRRLRHKISRAIGLLALFFNREPKEIALTNLERCMPALDHKKRKALVRELFKLIGQSVWDYPLVWFGSRQRMMREIEIDGLQYLKNASTKGVPIILMVAHTAELDIAPPRLAMEIPMSGPYKPFGNKLADWLIMHGRSRFGNKPIPRNAGLRGLLQALRHGGVLYYLADEDYGSSRSVFVPFFGHQKATLPIIGRLANSTNATVLPTMTIYDDKSAKYRVIIDPPLEGFPSGDEKIDAKRMNQTIESQIARYPSHYLWTLKLFRTRPEGEETWYLKDTKSVNKCL